MRMRALYVSHTGMTEPLGQSQVLSYVRGLAAGGWEMEILAFEPASSTDAQIARVQQDLESQGIGYRWTRRSPSHLFPVKVYEFSQAALRLWTRALLRRPRVVHARSYLPGAVAGLVAALTPGARFLFDLRGLLGEEYVDSGHWSSSSYQFRLLKQAERQMLARADGVVVLTNRHREWLKQQGLLPDATPTAVIPCCVDLSKFQVSDEQRETARAALAAGDKFVLLYSGTLGPNYRHQELIRLFKAVRRRRPAVLSVLTHSPTEAFWASVDQQGVSRDDVRAVRVPPADMPRFLAAADAAVCFMSPTISRIGTSPTKVPEYLALGLPVVMNRGIGDSDQLMKELPFVIDAGAMGEGELEAAADALLALDREAVRPVARRAAEQRFSLQDVGIARYAALYDRLAR